MRRVKLVLAVAAAMAIMMVAFAAPAMAKGHGNDNDSQLDRQDIRLDKQLLNDRDDFEFNHFNRFEFNDNSDFFTFGVPFFFVNDFGFENSCPFAGDTEGIVNEFDCFD
jgi:hypothetical protein